MSNPIYQPHPRWYWSVPFTSTTWSHVSSLNPFVGPESGSAASGASRSSYCDFTTLGISIVAQDSRPVLCWDHQRFYMVDLSGDLDLFVTDDMLIGDFTQLTNVAGVGGRNNSHLLIFPELGYYVVNMVVDDPSTNDNLIRRIGLDGTGSTTIATLTWDDDDEVDEEATATRRNILYWCADRVNGVIYSVEQYVEYTAGVVTLIEHQVWSTAVSDGTRDELYSIQIDPEPTYPKRLYPPKWCYLNEQVLLCEEEHTGAWSGGGDDTYDQVNILGIEPDTTVNTILSYESPYVLDAGDKVALTHPTAVWTSGLTNKMYQTRSPISSGNESDADVGLFQYDLDGTNEERLCNDPRDANFGYSSFVSPNTVLGPGTRGAWEL